ncbi:MAG: hypothetical protein J5789_03515 [Oscillospiraceae bacterium]|nr:hypothetical protein [Oscillospiraceae bacterium]
MKKWIALAAVGLLLAIGLVLLLRPGSEPAPTSGPETTAAPAVVTTTQTPTVPTTTEAPPARLTGLVEAQGLEIGLDEGVFGLYSANGMGYILLQHWDQEIEGLRYRLAVLDPETAAVTEITELADFPADTGLSRMVVTDTELLLIDEYGGKCGAFDRTGAFLGLRDYPAVSTEDLGRGNRLLNDSCFWKNTDYAGFTYGSDDEFSQIVAFYDEEDRIHFLREPFDAVETVSGHRLLTRRYLPDEGLAYTLLDLDEQLCLGEIKLYAEEVEGAIWVNPCGSTIGADWVLLTAEWSAGDAICRRALFWYPQPEEQSPLEEEVLTEQNLKDRIAALKAELETLGLTFHLDEAPPPELTSTYGLDVDENVCEVGASLFGQYRILTDLKGFTEKLPDGFVEELFSRMPDPEMDRDTLHIFIVRNIPGDAAGFANAWSEPMLICFATEEYDPSHPAHEFMHIIDYRLNDYSCVYDLDYETAWLDLSPTWAYEESELLNETQLAEVGEYFVSEYARSNTNEDRAETFERLFNSTNPLEEWWYSDSPKVQAKVARLIEMIREAFPSVQAVERAWWEKLPE